MGKYRVIGVAEKRAMLTAAGEEWPVCECHGEPRRWNARPSKIGGTWECSVKSREANCRGQYYNKWRAKKNEQGLCETCGKEPLSSVRYCKYCLGNKSFNKFLQPTF